MIKENKFVAKYNFLTVFSRPPPSGPNQRPPYNLHYSHGGQHPRPYGQPHHGQNGPLTSMRPPQRGSSLPTRLQPDQMMPPVAFKRRQGQVSQEPLKLPNILPQFRPNAKTSHGHRGPDKVGEFCKNL